jgi:cytochrome b561
MQAERGGRYSGVAMLLHWAIAILVIMNWQIAEGAHEVRGPLGAEIMGYHKAWGMTILTLTLIRLAWRLAHPSVVRTKDLKPWERMLAKTVHITFYVLLIALPLGGWLANSLMGKPVDFFGLFTIPALPVGANKELGGTIFDVHETGAKFMLLLILLHVAGALKHTIIDRDGTLWRMLPFGTPMA